MTITMTLEDAEGIQNLLKRMRSENQALRAAAGNVLDVLENGINGEPINRTIMANCVVQLREAMGI